MSENSKRPVTVRFDKEVHERLQQMSQDSGDSITELVRNLVERALEKNTHTELLVQTQALTRRVAQIEQMLGHALPTLHQRLAGIEQLICSADANAARRDALDFARHYDLFKSTRYGIWELQTVIVHVLEYAMLTHGNSREVAYKFHADCQDASSRGFKRFRATVEEDIAAIDAGAPAPLQPPPAPELAFARPSELPDDAEDTAEAGEEEPESDLPTAPAAGAATRRPNGNGAAANTAGEGV
jgi:predicted DNA-binding protein